MDAFNAGARIGAVLPARRPRYWLRRTYWWWSDRLGVSALTATFVLGLWFSWPSWVVSLALLGVGGIVYGPRPIREFIKTRRWRRRQRRAFHGTVLSDPDAIPLRLVTAGNRIPRITRDRWFWDAKPQRRELDFALPPGLVAADVEAVLPALVGYFVADSGTVEPLGPGLVRLHLFDDDPLDGTETTDWAGGGDDGDPDPVVPRADAAQPEPSVTPWFEVGTDVQGDPKPL